MGEEYHVRGAPRIPPLVVVVSITSDSTLTRHFNVVENQAKCRRSTDTHDLQGLAPPSGVLSGLKVNLNEDGRLTTITLNT